MVSSMDHRSFGLLYAQASYTVLELHYRYTARSVWRIMYSRVISLVLVLFEVQIQGEMYTVEIDHGDPVSF